MGNHNGASCASSAADRTKSTAVPATSAEFLRRQSEHEAERQRRLAELEAYWTPAGRPALCRESLRIAERQKERRWVEEREAELKRALSFTLSSAHCGNNRTVELCSGTSFDHAAPRPGAMSSSS